MTDFARLAMEIDSRDVKTGVAELDNLTAAGKRAEQATNQVTAAAGRHNQQMAVVTRSAGEQRAGMQQLSYQIGDVAQQFALGTNPMIIFAQQGQQVVQALTMMRGGATGLIGFLGGPWGGVIMGAATVVGMFASKLYESGDAANSAAKDYRSAADAARDLIGAQNALKLNQAMIDRNKLTEQRFELENLLATGIRSGPTGAAVKDRNAGFFSTYQQVDDVQNRIRALKLQEAESNNLISIAERENAAIEKKAAASKKAGSATEGHTRAVRAHTAAVKDAVDWNKLLLEGLGKFDPEIQKRMQGISAETASDIAQMRSASEAAFEQTYKGMNRAAEANLEWNDQLRDTIGYLNQIGGFGSTLADIGGVFYGLKTGDFGGVGGPLGAVAKSFQLAFPDFSEKLVTGFDKVLQDVFGKNGSFTNLLAGAGTGTAMGSLLFGNNKGAQVGGSIGGAIGSLLPIPGGKIIGSIIGSTLGKLLGSGAKYGSAVVGPNGVVVGGNNDNSKGAATGAGGAVSSAIEQIAQALGGTVGNYAVSIGETDGKWRISTTGRSGELKSKYSDVKVFGKGDAAAEQALKAAIADAIKDGAIQGVSAAVGRLLQGGGDIDKQVQKAQLFQGVFSELKAQTDPLGAALDGVAKQFDALRKIFDEAGASTEEYASLEQLLGIKRQEAIDAARQANVDKISDQFTLQIRALELLGKGEAALAASRLLELAGMKDTLKPIQEMIYQLEDAQAVMSQFKPLADDLRAYRKELVGTSSVASYGAARALFASTAASAAMGDAAALGNLRGVSDSYLASAKANARSGLDYNRARGQVLAAVDQGIFAADTKVDYAQATIDAIDNSAQIMQSMREELRTLGEQTAANTSFTANLLRRLEGPDGLQVSNTNGTPLQVEIVT